MKSLQNIKPVSSHPRAESSGQRRWLYLSLLVALVLLPMLWRQPSQPSVIVAPAKPTATLTAAIPAASLPAAGERAAPALSSLPTAVTELAQEATLPAPARMDQILVRPIEGLDPAALAGLHASLGTTVRKSYAAQGGLQVVQLPASMSVERATAAFVASGLVTYAEPDFIVRALAEPNDFRFWDQSQWPLKNSGIYGGTVGADISATTAWDVRTSAESVIVAVIDTGIRTTHEDLVGALWTNPGEIAGNGIDDDANGYVDDVHGINAITGSGNPEDDAGHGSFVAGLIGATGDNSVGIAGVAWRTKLMALKFMDPAYNGTISDAIECIEYAREHGATVINASWGGYAFNSTALRDAIGALAANGIIFVAAAGNDNINNDSQPLYPASYTFSHIIAVASTNRNDGLSHFSNYGLTHVDLAAPGDVVYSAWNGADNDYRYWSGTSMAAAHVSGAVALLRAEYAGESADEIVDRVLSTTDALPVLAGKTVTGGRLNLGAAMGSGDNPPPTGTPGIVTSPGTQAVAVGASATFTVSATNGPLTYLWKKNGVTISGATSNSYSLASAAVSDSGVYEVYVTNANGTVRVLFYLNVRSTGSVTAWGDNASGQTNVPVGLSARALSAGVGHTLALRADGTVAAWGLNANGQTNVPAGLSGVVHISAGRFHSVALKSDGTVVAWGLNDLGQTNVPAGLTGVVWVAAGGNHNVAIRYDGSIVTWGDNGSGQRNVPAGLESSIIGVAGGTAHTLALKSDGTVVAWGSNSHGQLTVPAGLTGVSSVEAGAHHSTVVRNNGTVAVWGRNDFGQTNPPAGLGSVTFIAHRANHLLALRANGTVVGWGYNEFGQATVPSSLSGVLTVAAGTYHSAAIVAVAGPTLTARPQTQFLAPGASATFSVSASGSGLTYAWKRNGVTIAGATSSSFSISSAATSDNGAYEVLVTDASGTSRSVFYVSVRATGSVTAWGDNASGQLNVPAGLSAREISTGVSHTIALRSNGTVAAWGLNANGQTNVPAGLSGVVHISAGRYHSVALRSDGTVVAWGLNDLGQTNVPAGLTGVAWVVAGGNHNVAIRYDGSIVTWGDNASGQRNVPAGLESSIIGVAGGTAHTIALKSDGTVVAWGSNSHGQLNVPAGLTGISSVEAGAHHSVVLRNNGTISVWGRNDFGQINPPAGLNTVTFIANRANHLLALRSNGTVAGWGYNEFGQATVPAGLSGVLAVAAGTYHSAAIVAP